MSGAVGSSAGDLQRAQQLLELGRAAQAQEIVASLLAGEPHNATALRLAARCHMALGADGLAVTTARHAVAADPAEEHGFRILAETLRRTKNHQEAAAAARTAVSLAPTEARAHLQLAQCLYRVSFKEALSEAERACALGPEVAGAHYLRGALLRRLNRREEARAAFLQALRIDPQHAAAMTGMAMLDRGLRAWRGRLRGIQRALGASPQSATSRFALENVILTRLWRLGVLAMLGVQIVSSTRPGPGSGSGAGTRATAVVVLVILVVMLWFSLWPARADLGLFGCRLLRTDRRALACELVISSALLLIGAAAVIPAMVGGVLYVLIWLAMTGVAAWGLYQLRAMRRAAVRNPDTL